MEDSTLISSSGGTTDAETQEQEASQFAPGELCAVDAVSPDDVVDLTLDDQSGLTQDDKENCIKNLCSRSAQRDLTSRRIQLRDAWKLRLFWRGAQHLLPYRGGWALPGQVPGQALAGQPDEQSSQETNIFLAHGQGIVSALTAGLPSVRFEAQDPQNPADTSAAEAAEKARLLIERSNDMIVRQGEVARYMWTDEVAYMYTREVIDAQRFGWEKGDDDLSYLPETGGEGPDATSPVQTGAPPQNPPLAGGAQQIPPPAPSPTDERGEPRSEETIEVFGCMEVKTAIQANHLSDTPYLQFSRERDITMMKSAYPKKADSIKPQQAPTASSDYERLARTSVMMGIRPTNVTSDSMTFNVTEQRTWIRPGFFTEETDDTKRQWLYQNFPDGLMSVLVGQEVCEARNESLDDHWTMIHGQYGDGAHRPALGAPIVPINEKLNDCMDLVHESFMHLIPRTWVDPEGIDVKALNETRAQPKSYLPLKARAGQGLEQSFYTEPSITIAEGLLDYIEKLFGEWSQFLSGDFPALFGGSTGSNDTAAGIQGQRDQALGRVGLAWRAMRAGYASCIKQAVQCAAKYRKQAMSGAVPRKNGSGLMNIAIDPNDLKGNILCFPDTDENFPESWVAKRAVWTNLLTQMEKNPILAQMMQAPSNMRIAKDYIGVPEMIVPGADADEKQLGQIMEMLNSEPMPNPELQQAQMALEQAGPPPDPQMAQQVQQALQQIPPEVSSIPIDPDVDDMPTMIATIKTWANSQEGIRAKAENPRGYQNVILQMKAREQFMAQQQQPPQQKPPSESINFKDLDPMGKVQMGAQAGIKIDPNAIVAKDQQDRQDKAAALQAKQKSGEGPIQ